jgi:hypothetical protein
MNTVSDLKKRVLLLLGDSVASGVGEEVSGNQYSVDALLAGIHASLDAILPWVWRKKIQALTTSTDGYAFTLPTDFFQVEGVVLSTKYLNEVVVYPVVPRMQVFSSGRIPDNDEPYFLMFPGGYITFSYKIDLTAGAKLFYAATWTKPTTDATPLETPEYALTALSYYAAAHCLLGSAVSTANIRQYATKVDSGNPQDNPLLNASTYMQRMFDIAVQRLPTMPHGTIE